MADLKVQCPQGDISISPWLPRHGSSGGEEETVGMPCCEFTTISLNGTPITEYGKEASWVMREGAPDSPTAEALPRRPVTPVPGAARSSTSSLTARYKVQDAHQWCVTDSPNNDGVVLESLGPAIIGDSPLGSPGSPESGRSLGSRCSFSNAIPLKAVITKIGCTKIESCFDFEDWIDCTPLVKDCYVCVHWRSPLRNLDELMRIEGRELHAAWRARMAFLQGLWTDRGGMRLFRIDGFEVSVLWDVSVMSCPDLPRKQIIPLNDEIWMDALCLVLSESTTNVLTWFQSDSQAKFVWRRPKKGDICFLKSQGGKSGESMIPSPPQDSPSRTSPRLQALRRATEKDRSKQGKLGRVLRGFICCSSEVV